MTSTKMIEITTCEVDVNDAALAALRGHANLFQRGGRLVQVLTDERDGAPRVRVVPDATLREELTRCVDFVSGARKPAHPPRWLVGALSQRGNYPGIRYLRGVIEGSAFVAGGHVVSRGGYDDASNLFNARANAAFALDTTTPSHALADRLLDLVADFPFARAEGRSIWLALLLTWLARHAIKGPVPLFLFDANSPGTGKSRLADLASILACGRPMARQPVPTDPEETRKLITSIALSGQPAVLLDNVVGSLGSGQLDAALTSDTWSDRLLGGNELVELPLTAIFVATGNNIELRGDLPRRCLYCRLESPVERPEERQGFRHADLLGFARANRDELVSAALTLLVRNARDDSAARNVSPFGSFEAWSRVVRGTIALAGLPDPCATRGDAPSAQEQASAALHLILRHLETTDTPATARELAAVPALREALEVLAPPRNQGDPINPHALGQSLARHRDTIVCGLCLRRFGSTSPVRWRAERVDRGVNGVRGAELLPNEAETNGSANGAARPHQPHQPHPPLTGGAS